MKSLQACFAGARDLAGRATTLLILLALGLTACHSSNDGGQTPPPPPPPPPAPSGIGPAGGTVNGPNGSSVVIPAGALTAFVNIAIAQSSAGLPALPAGTEVAGEIYSFTPHGTTFAAPVRVTVPFDPALVPAGRNLELLKTNATNTAWGVVAPVTVNGALLSADVSGFSGFVVTIPPSAPTITTHPSDVTVAAGDSASFAVVASANGAELSYQWRRGGIDIAGATGVGYTLTPVMLSDDGATFSVVVTNSVGSVESQAAVLTVSAPPPSGNWQTIGGAVNTAGPVRYPSIAVSPDGTIYVAYGEGSSGVAGLEGSLFVRRWDTVSLTWVPMGNGALNTGIGLAPEWPSLRVGTDGVPVVAWVNRSLTLGNEVVVQRWNSGAGAWQRIGGAPSGISGGSLTASGVQLVLGPGDQPHVVFSEGICNVYRTWDGLAWIPDPQRACASSNQSAAGLAIRSDGFVFVAGSPVPPPPQVNGVDTELRNWVSVRYRGSNDQGFFNSEFGNVPVNPVPVDEILVARVALSTINNSFEVPIVAYASRTGSGVGAVMSLNVRGWDGISWSPMGPELLAGSGLVSTSPMRMATSPGRTGVLWLTRSLTSNHIAGRLWTGAMWETISSPHAGNANILHFDVTVGPDTRPYVAAAEIPANSSSAAALFVRTCDGWCVVP